MLPRIGVLLVEMAAVALAHHACRLRRFVRLASAPHECPGRTPKTPKNVPLAIACPRKRACSAHPGSHEDSLRTAP